MKMFRILLCSFLFTHPVFILFAEPEADWNRLYVSSSTASSFLKGNWNKYEENYHPNYAFDDNPNTAWVEGKDGYGDGESISWPISALGSANSIKLKIRNGYQKSRALLESNSAPKRIKISIWNEPHQLIVEKDFELIKERDWQEIELSIPHQAGIKSITLTILDTTPGQTYKDTCISDIQTYVQSEVPYQKKLEENKNKILKKWIAERIETAKYFASLPPTYPFSSTTFENNWSGKEERKFNGAISKQREKLFEFKSLNTNYQVVHSGNPIKYPDGIDFKIPYLNLKNLSFFETKKNPKKIKIHKDDDDVEIYRGNIKIQWDPMDKKTPIAIYFEQKRVENRREIYESHERVLLTYENGKLISILELNQGRDSNFTNQLAYYETTYTNFEYDSDGKIYKIEKFFRTSSQNGMDTATAVLK